MFDQKHQNLSGSLETNERGVLIAFFFAAYDNDHSLSKFHEMILKKGKKIYDGSDWY